jgi:unsaturated chondroitin disaccharide hydrolase
MITIDYDLKPTALADRLQRFFSISGETTELLRRNWSRERGTPVFTIEGEYTTRGWTEWTQGFQYGNAIYQFDAGGAERFLEYGRESTVGEMATHVSHFGVHDHGFNNVSTYGNLLRLMSEGRIPEDRWERRFYELALKISGAVQAARWTPLPDDLGYIYTFNGPHSLFVDTMRTLRILALGYRLGHVYMGEQDERVSLLKRLLQHAETTARYSVYYGTGRDSYDLRGRAVHEVIFNVNNGVYRCPSTQQGYSPFSTWTRGLSWVLAGYPEQLEFIETLTDDEVAAAGFRHLPTKDAVRARFLEVARAVADFYIEYTPTDGIPYWDTGAPGLAHLGDYLDRPADPYNDYEPVDSSAAAIGAQGLLRLGRYLSALDAAKGGDAEAGRRYTQAGLTVSRTLLGETYVSTEPHHEGILLHSVYHRPNGWDNVPQGQKVPNGESCMWGDYHMVELAVYLKRLAEGGPYLTFFNIGEEAD